MKIREMKTGTIGRVAGYSTDDRRYRQKLIQMGLVRGVEFKLERVAPLGDPVELRLQGGSLTLRKAEADALNVEEV
ncbi:FeoA family protein [Tichowtungia aerotolerans]|uniref:Ferrous iron transport protein A n=1 Tax=Tichowtungia aerotolerans TaxID=2697043 RepID=A0A6P1M2G6_9BACT|nr:FeoA family protein [Tichowtungia aerotolerans]QHI68302.1 ferrous iron transport protein A [Tichowtungia aerotolerans]